MTDSARDGKGRFVENEETAERDAEAFRMRARGRLLREIAAELGFYDESAVRAALQRRNNRVTGPAVAEYRREMDAQLDELHREAMKVLEAKHLRINNGEIVHADGEPVIDDAPVLRAIETILKVQERRARLHGLDAPTKVQAEVQSVRVSIEGAEDV
jgi:hypothetical protein